MKKLLRHFASNWSVQKKGLLLVGIPLIFQLVLTVVLGILYSQAEQQAFQESKARTLMVQTNKVLSSMNSAGQMLVVYTARPTEEVYKQWLVKKEVMLADLDALRQASVQRSDTTASYHRLLEISNRGVRLMDDAFRHARAKTPVSLFKVFPEVKVYLDTLNDELQFVLTDDLHAQIAGTMSQESKRKLIATILYAGVCIDVVLAIGLSFFFSASIVSRLNVITDNTKKLGTRANLNDLLQGSDEIANLDLAFHELSEQLKSSEQLRSEFVAMVSHDLRTPLMSVELSMQQVQTKLSHLGDAEVQDELASTQRNIKRVMNLIRDLLDLERGATGKLNLEVEELSVRELFERINSSLQAFATQKDVRLTAVCSDETVFADSRRLDQVLVNLTANALKFAPAGTEVQLSAQQIGGEVEISVSDQGPGVSEKEQSQIFERFVQASHAGKSGDESTRSGYGLGLAICKTIIDSHGGSIGYTPNPGGGSRFWVKLKSAD